MSAERFIFTLKDERNAFVRFFSLVSQFLFLPSSTTVTPVLHQTIQTLALLENFTIATEMSSIRIEPNEEKYFKDVDRIRASFLDSKHMLCCLPLGLGSKQQARKDYEKCPDMMNVCGVAIHPEKGPIGICQIALEGMPCEIHKVQAGEAYVLILAVDDGYRGMGVGSALLDWADKVAKERGCTFISLEAIWGNPAIGLYERKGYVEKKAPLWKEIACFLPICCFMSPIICTEGASNYCSCGRTVYMDKPLE